MISTIWCLIIPIISMMLAGLVVRGLLARGKALDDNSWLQVPFIGIAVTVLILQFQLYLDIPVKRGVIALGVFLALCSGAWLLWGKVKDSLRQFPVLPFAVAVVVLLIHAIGLMRVGPRDYAGRSWPDQFNYTVMAEYFRGWGFDVKEETLDQQAWLVRVPDLKNRRIGQSVLHAYHGVITRMDTRSQFMPTILLACPLLALALFAVGRRAGLPPGHAALASFFGGLAPGIGLLVQESFLSHALGIPYLFLLPVLLSLHNAERTWTSLLTAVLCLGALASIYSEFLMMELVLVAAFFVLTLLQNRRDRRHCLSYAVLLAAPWLCNPLYKNLTAILTIPYMSTANLLSHVYPWAYEAVGFGVLWCGDKCVTPVALDTLKQLATIVGLIVTIAGAVGLAGLVLSGALRWWRGERDLAANGLDLRLAILMLGLLPAIMLLREHNFPYHYFKLLITICPLYALGMVALAMQSAGVIRPTTGKLVSCVVWLPVLAAAGFAVHGCWRMAWHSARPDEVFRTNQSFAFNADFLAMRTQLEATRNQDILLRPAWGYRLYDQIWGLYFARHNNVWLAFPYTNDVRNVRKNPLYAPLADLTKLPPRHLVVCPNHSVYLQPPKSLPAHNVLWENGTYKIWQYESQPWACLTHIENPNGGDCHNDCALWLGGGDTVVDVFASQPGSAKLTLNLRNGPCIDPSENLRLSINDGRGSPYVVEMAQGSLVVPMTLLRGSNTLIIEVLNTKQLAAKGDPRPLLAECYFGEMEFQPGPLQTSVPTAVHGN